ncbi:hypothetical protein [uncultured Paludibaculum sp.]|uniref:hypothetical protein n=1 Tax=uncultured Paludibaculum sp. TaxID=1765020 RepID=UPI002AABF558|nr:hypothetical protein [uncultured Paludibaculum sp.]
MKLLLTFLLLATVAAAAFAADTASLTGKWQIHTSAAGNESKYSCTFTQKESDLTGSCSPERGVVQINGKVEGSAVRWTYKSDYNGSPLTVTFKGTLDSTGKISGSVVAEEFGVEGEFSATPEK